MSKRLGGIIGCKYKTSSWHLNGFPMVVTLGQQYNIGEKPIVILYTYINRHAGTPEKQRRQNSTSSNVAVIILYCYVGCEVEVTTLKREQRGPNVDIFNIIQKVQDTVITWKYKKSSGRSHTVTVTHVYY